MTAPIERVTNRSTVHDNEANNWLYENSFAFQSNRAPPVGAAHNRHRNLHDFCDMIKYIRNLGSWVTTPHGSSWISNALYKHNDSIQSDIAVSTRFRLHHMMSKSTRLSVEMFSSGKSDAKRFRSIH
jgi:hypothetical protein